MGYGSSARESVELRSAANYGGTGAYLAAVRSAAGSRVQEVPVAVGAVFGFVFAGVL
jgi:hypothetical protein